MTADRPGARVAQRKIEGFGPRLLIPPPLTAVESPVESFDTPLRIHDALLTRVKGMAIAANLDTELWLGGPGLESVAARAGDGGVEETRVNFGLHTKNPCQLYVNGIGSGLVEGVDANAASALGSPLVLDLAIGHGEERVVAPESHIVAGTDPGTALPHQNGAPGDTLTTEALDSQPL